MNQRSNMLLRALFIGFLVVNLGATQARAQVSPSLDTAGFIGDLLHARVTSAKFDSGDLAQVQVDLLGATGGRACFDLAVNSANSELYVLTSSALEVFSIDRSREPAQLNLVGLAPVRGTHLALSPDGRTAYIGSTGKVFALNLFPEIVPIGEGKFETKPAYEYVRTIEFDKPDRAVAAMGVHPSGDRLFVVIDMDPSKKKIDINNDLLRSDVGRGTLSEQIEAELPDDFGYVTQLDISDDVKTGRAVNHAPKFVASIGIKDLIYKNEKSVAIGIKGLAFSPDGNCLLLTAVGAQTSRATPFGIMPTSDEGTGGIIVLDVRPRPPAEPWVEYLGFIPTVEKDEKTAEIRQEIRREGWYIVHPEVQLARTNFLTASGQLGVATSGTAGLLSPPFLTQFLVAAEALERLESSFGDYGYMQAYVNLYPRDMVGASSVAIASTGNFGVVSLQDTNNLGLLALDVSTALSGYTAHSRPTFYIGRGTGKTVNGFDPALTLGNPSFYASSSAYAWAYPQEVALSSDDSRLYIGMAGGTPRADLTNVFGSANALTLRDERDRHDGPLAGANPPPGYSLYSGGQKSPRQVATFHGFDADYDGVSNLVEAYNRWNDLRVLPPSLVDTGDSAELARIKSKLISTNERHISDPTRRPSESQARSECLDAGYLLPGSGIGYRLNRFGMPENATNFGTKGVIATIEEIGREWHRRYTEHLGGSGNSVLRVTRPYFVVGLMSQPGGGIIKNPTKEALKYTSGNGIEAAFPYLSVGMEDPAYFSDEAHDFVISNNGANPVDNSSEIESGFDKTNTEALIRLLLGHPRVLKVELDPYVLDLIPAIATDPRIVPHGSRTVTDCRRDLDNHMFVTFGCLSVDLDVDSDNNGIVDNSDLEDRLEEDVESGKLVWPNYGDRDADGVPDFADGYDQFEGEMGSSASADFTPMIIRIPEELDVETLSFRIVYSESDPGSVIRSEDGYTHYVVPEAGAYRVWTKDGPAPRRKADLESGGDLISSGKLYSIAFLSLNAEREVTIFVESVRPSRNADENRIDIELFPNAGPQTSITRLTDSVYVKSGLRLAMYPQPGLTDDGLAIAASEGRVYLQAVASIESIGGQGERVWKFAEEGSLVRWEVEGGVGEAFPIESWARDGVANSEITTSKSPGDTHRVKCVLSRLVVTRPGDTKPMIIEAAGGVATAELKLNVVPGPTASIVIERSVASTPADGMSRTTMTAFVRDAVDNPVADGTPVSWFLPVGGVLDLRGADSVTIDGKCVADVVADEQEGSAPIFLQADQFTLDTAVDANFEALNIQLIAERSSLDIDSLEETRLVATVASTGGTVPDGTPVHWWTSTGEIIGGETVVGGVAVARLRARGVDRETVSRAALVRCGIGSRAAETEVWFARSKPFRAQVENHALLAVVDSGRALRSFPIPYFEDGVSSAGTVDTPNGSAVHIKAGIGNAFGSVEVTLGYELPGASGTFDGSEYLIIALSPNVSRLGQDRYRVLLDGFGQSDIVLVANKPLPDALAHLRFTLRMRSELTGEADIFQGDYAADTAFEQLYSVAAGFVWGGGRGFQATAADFASSMLVWGDIRDILIQVGRLTPGGEESDPYVFGFAVAGLAVNFIPGLGTAADVFASSAKIVLKGITSPNLKTFKNLIGAIPKRVLRTWWMDPAGSLRMLEDAADYMKFLSQQSREFCENVGSVSSGVRVRGSTNVPDLDALIKLHKLSGGRFTSAIEKCFRAHGQGGAGKLSVLFKELYDGVPNGRNAWLVPFADGTALRFDEAVDGAAVFLKKGEPKALEVYLSNDKMFTSTYDREKFLVDLGELLTHNPDLHSKGLGDMMRVRAIRNKLDAGTTFEIASAASFRRRGDSVLSFGGQFESLRQGSTGIGIGVDLITESTAYSVKMSAREFRKAVAKNDPVGRSIERYLEEFRRIVANHMHITALGAGGQKGIGLVFKRGEEATQEYQAVVEAIQKIKARDAFFECVVEVVDL